MTDQIIISEEGSVSRIFIHATPSRHKEDAVQHVLDLFATAEKVTIPHNHLLVERTVSMVLTLVTAPNLSTKHEKISSVQQEYIQALAKEAKINPFLWCRDIFDTELPQLNKLQAYAFIATLEKSTGKK